MPWPSAITWTSTWRAGLDHALDQHARVAEGLLGLGAGALERGRQRAELIDAADAAPAAARRGLDHQREADLLSMGKRLLHGRDRAAAPRRDRHAGLLGQALGRDLVAQRAHDVGVGADEDDPEPLAQLGERRVLGHEAPADPGGVGPRGGQRALERAVVEVGAAARAVGVDHRGAEADRLVGLADEHRVRARPPVKSAISRIGSARCSLSSRTAWITRIAGSPRLTMASRVKGRCMLGQPSPCGAGEARGRPGPDGPPP